MHAEKIITCWDLCSIGAIRIQAESTGGLPCGLFIVDDVWRRELRTVQQKVLTIEKSKRHWQPSSQEQRENLLKKQRIESSRMEVNEDSRKRGKPVPHSQHCRSPRLLKKIPCLPVQEVAEVDRRKHSSRERSQKAVARAWTYLLEILFVLYLMRLMWKWSHSIKIITLGDNRRLFLKLHA
jgi:hypothetical protein